MTGRGTALLKLLYTQILHPHLTTCLTYLSHLLPSFLYSLTHFPSLIFYLCRYSPSPFPSTSSFPSSISLLSPFISLLSFIFQSYIITYLLLPSLIFTPFPLDLFLPFLHFPSFPFHFPSFFHLSPFPCLSSLTLLPCLPLKYTPFNLNLFFPLLNFPSFPFQSTLFIFPLYLSFSSPFPSFFHSLSHSLSTSSFPYFIPLSFPFLSFFLSSLTLSYLLLPHFPYFYCSLPFSPRPIPSLTFFPFFPLPFSFFRVSLFPVISFFI